MKQYVVRSGITWDVAMDNPDMENSFGGNVPLPTKFVIDRESRIVVRHVGGSVYAFYEGIVRPLLRGSTQVSLGMHRQGDALVFAWPATEFGYNLETRSTLGGTNWTVAPFPVVTTNDQNTVSVPVGPGSQFFRLRKTIFNPPVDPGE